MRRRLLLAAAAGLALAGSDLASSAWTAAAAGASTARSGVLAAPTDVSATRVPTGIALTWARSTTPWSTGQRVLRSPTAGGALTEVASLDATAAGYTDTAAHAGTWHYVVTAAAQAWAAPSARATAADAVHYLRATSTFTDARCPAAGTTTADLLQGHVAPTGPGTAIPLATLTLCTDTYASGQVLPAGTTTVSAYVDNTHARSCTVDLVLRHGAVVLGSGSGTIAGRSALHVTPWAFPTAGTSFAAGDRLTVQLTPRANSSTNNCGSTTVHGDGSLVPSHVTLAG